MQILNDESHVQSWKLYFFSFPKNQLSSFPRSTSARWVSCLISKISFENYTRSSNSYVNFTFNFHTSESNFFWKLYFFSRFFPYKSLNYPPFQDPQIRNADLVSNFQRKIPEFLIKRNFFRKLYTFSFSKNSFKTVHLLGFRSKFVTNYFLDDAWARKGRRKEEEEEGWKSEESN